MHFCVCMCVHACLRILSCMAFYYLVCMFIAKNEPKMPRSQQFLYLHLVRKRKKLLNVGPGVVLCAHLLGCA